MYHSVSGEAVPLGLRLQHAISAINLDSTPPELRDKIADLQITHGSAAVRDAALEQLQTDLLAHGQSYKEEVEKYVGDDTVAISSPTGNPEFARIHTYLEG